MVTIELGELARNGLESHFGPDLAGGARKALVHYAYKLRVGRPPIAPPRFLGDSPRPQVAVNLNLDAETEELLEREARRQQVSLTRLATHAVFVYLAELEFLGVMPRRDPTGQCS